MNKEIKEDSNTVLLGVVNKRCLLKGLYDFEITLTNIVDDAREHRRKLDALLIHLTTLEDRIANVIQGLETSEFEDVRYREIPDE